MALSKHHSFYALWLLECQCHCWLSRASSVTPSLSSEWVRGLTWHLGFSNGFGVGLTLKCVHGFILPSISLASYQSHLRVFKAGRVLQGHLLSSAIFVSPHILKMLFWSLSGVLGLSSCQPLWVRWIPEFSLIPATGSWMSLGPKGTSRAVLGILSDPAERKPPCFSAVGMKAWSCYTQGTCKGTNTVGSRAEGWRRETRLGWHCVLSWIKLIMNPWLFSFISISIHLSTYLYL